MLNVGQKYLSGNLLHFPFTSFSGLPWLSCVRIFSDVTLRDDYTVDSGNAVGRYHFIFS